MHDDLVFANESNNAEQTLLFTQDVVVRFICRSVVTRDNSSQSIAQPNPFTLRHALPRRYARFGLQWWRAHVVAYIARLSSSLDAEATRRWRALQLDNDDDDVVIDRSMPTWRRDADCVAVHIRRGELFLFVLFTGSLFLLVLFLFLLWFELLFLNCF